MLGLRKLTEFPRNVAAPLDDPVGARKPLGNGFESVERTGGTRVDGSGIVVCWLKPEEMEVGSGYRGSTRTPMPPRITVLLSQRCGVHAKPPRGLRMWDLVV